MLPSLSKFFDLMVNSSWAKVKNKKCGVIFDRIKLRIYMTFLKIFNRCPLFRHIYIPPPKWPDFWEIGVFIDSSSIDRVPTKAKENCYLLISYEHWFSHRQHRNICVYLISLKFLSTYGIIVRHFPMVPHADITLTTGIFEPRPHELTVTLYAYIKAKNS